MLRRTELSDGKMENWDNLGTTVLVLLKSTNSKQNKEEMDGRLVQNLQYIHNIHEHMNGCASMVCKYVYAMPHRTDTRSH